MTPNYSAPKKIPFQDVLAGLLNDDTPLNPRFLYRLSDLEGQELNELRKTWPKLSDRRKRNLLEDLEALFEADYLLSFEAICRLALNDANPQIRFVAIRSLQEYDVDDLIPVFIEILETDEDEELRALAAIALGKYVYLGEIEELPKKKLIQIENCLLKAAQGQEKTLVRRRAVESLGYSSRKEVPDLIESAYNAGSTDWLVTAIFAMGRSYNKRWHAKVIEMFDHPLPDVRFEAAKAAGELELAAAKPKLLELLEDDDSDTRMAAVWSLSQIGGEGLQNKIEKLLKKAESEEEVDIIEEALDNLIFNESIGYYDALDLDDDFDFADFDDIEELND
jgi:hypothetical protein